MSARLVSRGREVGLVSAVQGHGSDASQAFAQLETAFDPLLRSYNKRVGCFPHERGEVEQDIRIAFYHAVRRFDLTRNVRLAAFARPYLQGAVSRFRERRIAFRREESLEALIEGDEDGTPSVVVSDQGRAAEVMLEDLVFDRNIRPALQRFVASRPAAQRRLLVRMTVHNETQTEAAAALGCSRQAVSAAMIRVRRAARAQLHNHTLRE